MNEEVQQCHSAWPRLRFIRKLGCHFFPDIYQRLGYDAKFSNGYADAVKNVVPSAHFTVLQSLYRQLNLLNAAIADLAHLQPKGHKGGIREIKDRDFVDAADQGSESLTTVAGSQVAPNLVWGPFFKYVEQLLQLLFCKEANCKQFFDSILSRLLTFLLFSSEQLKPFFLGCFRLASGYPDGNPKRKKCTQRLHPSRNTCVVVHYSGQKFHNTFTPPDIGRPSAKEHFPCR